MTSRRSLTLWIVSAVIAAAFCLIALLTMIPRPDVGAAREAALSSSDYVLLEADLTIPEKTLNKSEKVKGTEYQFVIRRPGSYKFWLCTMYSYLNSNQG